MEQANYKDKEILTDLLCSEKQMATSYNTSMLESATPAVGTCFRDIFDEEHRMQKQIFDMMHKRGLYPTPQAEEKKISEAKATYGKTVNA